MLSAILDFLMATTMHLDQVFIQTW